LITHVPPAAFLEQTEAMGLAFDDGDLAALGAFVGHLLTANERMNLTRITAPDDAWIRHVFDALTLMPYFIEAAAGKAIDVGAGGGVPGIPLAICLPGVEFTLLEATGKKCDFLVQTVAALGLKNVAVVNGRAETSAHDREAHREMYDIVTARAVGPLPVLLELTVPFARIGGLVLAVKGEKAPQEIEASKQALHQLHAEVAQVDRTPTGRVVVVEKLRKSPRVYPRRPGEPKRAPIGGRSAGSSPASADSPGRGPRDTTRGNPGGFSGVSP
jgi:16S rRNA (guanine527-N7)-methyltransferase